MIATYFDCIIKREGGVICCGGIITATVEHLGITTEDLHPDMGESFLTYEVLFSMECLKVNSNGQGFFIQNEGDHFLMSNLFLTKIDGWENQSNWKLNGPIRRKVMQSTLMMGMFCKNNVPKTTPIYDPTTDADYGAMQAVPKPEAGLSNMHGDAQEPPEQEDEGRENFRRRHRERCRPREQPADEFQGYATHRLDDIYNDMNTMSQNWDRRWDEQAASHQLQWEQHQQWNEQNRLSWQMNNDWRTVEQEFWEDQRLHDVNQRQAIARLERMAVEAKEERKTMSVDLAYLMDAMENLNTRFPPPPSE